LYFLHFDFNPINLRSPKVESVATFLDLRSDPNVNANAINVIAPSAAAAATMAEGLRALPEVSRAATLRDFVPNDQDRKVTVIQTLANKVSFVVADGSIATSGDFILKPGPKKTACGSTVAPNASCVVKVAFAPTQSGLRTGNLTFTDNAPDSPQNVALSGTGK